MYDKIYCLGDSHAGTLSGFSDKISTIPIGPTTMHRVGTRGLGEYLELFFSTGEVTNEGLWVMAFGEIDVRCHINKQITEEGRDEDEVIETLVNNYITYIKTVHSDIAVMSVVPPVKFYSGTFDESINNPNYPFVGADEDRARYTLKLNNLLIQKCSEENFIYIDVYSHYKDEEGFLIKELSDNEVHIYQRDKVAEIVAGMGLI
jgi:hypothetical protein